MSDKKKTCTKYTSIGGQAVIEGVMMKGKEKIATSVRKSDGEIVTQIKDVSKFMQKYKINKIPIVRGVFAFFDSMITGVKCLMYSADQMDIEEETAEMSKFEKWIDNKLGDKVKDIAIYVAVALSLLLSITMFMIIPTIIAGFFTKLIKAKILLNLIEGAIKMLIFLFYLWAVSHMSDMKRVFEYHGAEHKTIACYEAKEELTVENCKKHSRLHPRCGTSFLLIVMVISILMFSLLSWENWILRICYRLLLLPLVAGVSYELIRLAGKKPNGFVGLITKPGLWLQKITTREPDDLELEVSITSMKAVIDGGDDIVC